MYLPLYTFMRTEKVGKLCLGQSQSVRASARSVGVGDCGQASICPTMLRHFAVLAQCSFLRLSLHVFLCAVLRRSTGLRSRRAAPPPLPNVCLIRRVYGAMHA